MDMLASKIRQDSKIEGLDVNGEEFKFRRCADDVVLKIKSPQFL